MSFIDHTSLNPNNMISTRLVVLLLFVSISAGAQDPYEQFAKAFGGNYNAQNFEAIYELTNDAFKAQVTKEQLVQTLTTAFTKAGKPSEIIAAQTTTEGKIFHVVCERETLILSVNLDASGKAAGLSVRFFEKYSDDPEEVIKKWKSNPASAGLVIGRIRNGQQDIQYLGVADKATSRPIDATSIFELGSISKPFTGILLHTLTAEGKISLDDPVNKFLPTGSHLPKVKEKDILIRHLVTHSSCLPRMPGNFNTPPEEGPNPYHHYSEKELLAFLPLVSTADCELGTSPSYSNFAPGLLSYILTKVSGNTYAELFNDRIAKPLKTKSLGIMGASEKWVEGYTRNGGPQVQWTFKDALVGLGGVDASAADMMKVLSFLMKPDDTPLGKAVVASKAIQLRLPQGAYGTFWMHQPKGSQTVLWHNGQTGGFSAFIGWIEGTQTGVFILSNNGEDAATALGVAIIGAEK